MLNLKVEETTLRLEMANQDSANLKAQPGGGVASYPLLSDKPQINGVTLIGDISSSELGITTTYAELPDKPQINGVTLEGNKTFAELGLTLVDDLNDGLMRSEDYAALQMLKYIRYGGTRYPIIGIYAREQGGIIASLVFHVDNGTPDGAGIGLPTGDAVSAVIAVINQRLENLESGKQDTLTFDTLPEQDSTNPVTSGGIYDAISDAKQDIRQDIADVRADIPTKTSELTNDGYDGQSRYVEADEIGSGILTIQKNGSSVGTFSANATSNESINITVPVTAADVSALPASTKYGASISVTINSTDYKVTTTLKDQDGNTLGTAQVIDLPLESVVVNGTYDAQNKKIVLTLENGNTIDIPVGDLVAGLQTEITAQNPLNADLVDDSTSTHKFTTAANLAKLAGIEADAEVNVQSDWNQTTDTADDYIKNKPTKTSDFTNDGADGTAAYLETDETAYRTAAIPWGKVDSTSTNKLFTATVPGITEYRNGVSVWLKNGVVTSTTGFTVNINGLGGKKCYSNMTAATQDSTIFNVAYTMLFVYDETLDSGNGGFYIYRGYDANTNTIGYQLRTNSTVMKTTDACRYYKIFFTSADGTHWTPASTSTANSATTAKAVNQRPINPFGEIVYCSANTNYAAGADIAASVIWEQYTLTLGYSFNRTGEALELTTKRPVYVKCAPQADGSAIMDADEPIVQALPSTDDGKIYIFLGIAYAATAIELVPMHPVYYFKDGAVRIWTGAATSAVQTLTAAEIDAICV